MKKVRKNLLRKNERTDCGQKSKFIIREVILR